VALFDIASPVSTGFIVHELQFFFPAPERIRISGWRGVFTKLEYLILNHKTPRSGSLAKTRISARITPEEVKTSRRDGRTEALHRT
jgi:hypothetical protein